MNMQQILDAPTAQETLDRWIEAVETAIPSLTTPQEQIVRQVLAKQLVVLKEFREYRQLLAAAYNAIPSRRLGRTVCVDPDPAGNTYEFTEHVWSKRIREILGIPYEPSGI